MKNDSVQTRLEQWEDAEYPDKRPRCKTMDSGRGVEYHGDPAKVWLFLFASIEIFLIYLILT